MIVNAASLFDKTPFPSADPAVLESWHKVTRISIDGAFYVCNELVPSMQQRAIQQSDSGVIVNIIDLSVRQPWHNYHCPCRRQSWIAGLDQATGARTGADDPRQCHRPRCCVATARVIAKSRIASSQPNGIPLERWGSAEDVAHAVRYLIEADYVTGEVMTVDGGEQIV